MGSRFILTVAVLSLAAGSLRAEAAVITEVNSFTGTTVFAVHGVDYATLIEAAPFNSTLGVLTGASVEFVGTAAPGVVVFNPPSPFPATLAFSPSIGLTASVQAPVGSPPADSFPTISQSLPTETAPVGANPGTSSFSVIGASEAVDITVTLPNDDLTNFAQNPVSVLNYSPITVSNPIFPNNFIYEPSITTDAEFITTFTYTPNTSGGTAVPEPAFLSLGLLGIGAAWLALARGQRSFT